jgi:hypothetical protein
VRDEIVRLFEGPRCELFARSRHPGFESWGDQVDHFSATHLNSKPRHGIRRGARNLISPNRSKQREIAGEDTTKFPFRNRRAERNP